MASGQENPTRTGADRGGMLNFEQRYDLLKTTVSRFDSYYHLSAVKASLLLTTNIILLAALASEESTFRLILTDSGGGRVWLLGAAALSLASTIFAVVVIGSYLSSSRQKQECPSVVFSSSIASSTVEDYLDQLSAVDEPTIVKDLGHLAHDLASGLTRKFRRINASLVAFLGAVLSMCVAYTIWLL